MDVVDSDVDVVTGDEAAGALVVVVARTRRRSGKCRISNRNYLVCSELYL